MSESPRSSGPRRIPSLIGVSSGGMGEENPLWLVVLSDLMTNLMLFFLVLYAFTRQPEAERKKMMDQLSSSFSGQETESLKEHKAEEAVKRVNEEAAAAAIKDLVDNKNAEVLVSEGLIRVRLSNPVYFASGSAELDPRAGGDLAPIARMLRAMPNSVIIEGHTDNRPIVKGAFKNNWQLSASRAANVRRYFTEAGGIPEERLIIAGYGEHRPVAPNDSRANRLKNRRIEIVVVRK